MKPGIKKRKSEEMKDVVISDTMISIKISRGNEYLFDELSDAVNETGAKSRNRLIESILIDYVEDRKKLKFKRTIEFNKIKSEDFVEEYEKKKIAE